MTKKRRMFDIDLPADAPAPEASGTAGLRRGPMATAIGETGASLRERAAAEAEIRAENDALAQEFVRLKKLGLVTDMIPLDAVRTTRLIRDRARHRDLDLGDLKASIQAVGLSNPIRVQQVAPGQYELIEGLRRLSALRELQAETGDPRWSVIPAGLVPAGETIETLYRRMVDENLVRKDISWAEMARLARAYVQDQVGGCEDLDAAINLLFASAGPQKRSYIRRFAYLLTKLETLLEHPESLPRSVGLAVANRLELEPLSITELTRALRSSPRRSAEEEVEILRRFGASAPAISPRGNPKGRGRPARAHKASLRFPLAGGEVRCTASSGRLELRAATDFAALDQERLEAAIEAFFTVLTSR